MKTNPNFLHKLVLFCGPSGSGKTTIVHHLMQQFPMMRFSVSATTRERRPNEEHGKDYYFLSVDEFKAKIQNDEFLEWEEVYKDRFYGTLKKEVERILNDGYVAIFDVDVEGGLHIRKQFGRQLLDVFVMPPSVDDLHKRLVARATESEDSLFKRLGKAEKEMTYAFQFNHVIVNSVLEDAKQEAMQMVKEFLEDVVPEPDEES
ncbi:MAG: guanylate kinase [Bacteroidetes bacterium]|nr:guanylate kinase [Bacteroidota bacterium]